MSVDGQNDLCGMKTAEEIKRKIIALFGMIIRQEKD